MCQGSKCPGDRIREIQHLKRWDDAKCGIDPSNAKGTSAKQRDDGGGNGFSKPAYDATATFHKANKKIGEHQIRQALARCLKGKKIKAFRSTRCYVV